MNPNGYKLKGPLKQKGYDWWWHSFTGRHSETGEERAFFIEYYIVNPGLMESEPLFGQKSNGEALHYKPSYTMIKAGCWGDGACQIHNFWGKDDFQAKPHEMDVRIASNRANDSELLGGVSLSPDQVADHPEYMSQSGNMSWDLKLYKTLSYSVGYGGSSLFQFMQAFEMFWHVEGMKTEMEGEVLFNGERYNVTRETSYGYQDKNWGRDYTNPWIWLNCNNLKLKDGQETLRSTSLDLGGGRPVIFGIPLQRKILIAFHHEGRLYEFNFSKFWKGNKQSFDCPQDEHSLYWNIEAQTRAHKIVIHFQCPQREMLLVNYENPDGHKYHNELWNGGTAFGTVKLYQKEKGSWTLLHEFEGRNGGCEFGEYFV